MDAAVDPFDLKQVMWAMSVKVNPTTGDVMILPNLSVNLLDPAAQPEGMITYATTPIAPDIRGNYGEELDTPQGTDAWRTTLTGMIKELRR